MGARLSWNSGRQLAVGVGSPVVGCVQPCADSGSQQSLNGSKGCFVNFMDIRAVVYVMGCDACLFCGGESRRRRGWLVGGSEPKK